MRGGRTRDGQLGARVGGELERQRPRPRDGTRVCWSCAFIRATEKPSRGFVASAEEATLTLQTLR